MSANLREQKARLQRFRDCLHQLRHGIEFRRQDDRKIFYTVDFSEIYSYLHYGDRGVKNFGVSIFAPADEDEAKSKAEEQHYLALTHLFKTLTSEPLYLLQPYVLEMYSYARSQAHRGKGLTGTLKGLIQSIASNIKPEHRKLLRDDNGLTEEQKRELLKVMLAEYPRLSIDLLEFDRWRRQNQELSTRGQLLNSLLSSNRLTHRTDLLLRELGFHETQLERPSLEDELRLADLFPKTPGEDAERQFSRLVDARALLLLRNINRLLETRGARLVLITRDAKTPTVASQFAKEEWFGWGNAAEFFYGIETVFIDLILQRVSDDGKLRWLDKADNELTTMMESVEEVLREANTDGASFSSSEVLSAGAYALLRQNSEHWNKLIDVEFILASPHVEWLGHDFVTKRVLAQHGNGHEPAEAKQIFLLEQLVALIDSDEFQEVASKGAQELWFDLAADAFGMNKLGIFSDELNNVLSHLAELLTQKFDEPELFRSIVAKSKSFVNMPTVQFKHDEYNLFAQAFRPWAYQKEEVIDKLGQRLADLFTRAVSDTNHPENCLFMAFLMGMLDYWDHSVEMAEHGLAKAQHRERRELEFFLANAVSRLADMRGGEAGHILGQYVRALTHIRNALKYNPIDPRYMERLATISLKYHERLRQYARAGGAALNYKRAGEPLVSEQEATGLLKEVVKRAHNDRRLRVRALNNLAYVYGGGENPMLEDATECLRQLDREFDDATGNDSDSLPDKEKWPFVLDTIWYIGARVAYMYKNADELKRNIDLLEVAREKANLIESEYETIAEHVREAKQWLQELEGSPAQLN